MTLFTAPVLDLAMGLLNNIILHVTDGFTFGDRLHQEADGLRFGVVVVPLLMRDRDHRSRRSRRGMAVIRVVVVTLLASHFEGNGMPASWTVIVVCGVGLSLSPDQGCYTQSKNHLMIYEYKRT